MRIKYDLNELCCDFKDCYLTIGNFDGVHLGHQHLLNELVTQSKKHAKKAVVITFKEHPKKILSDITHSPVCTLEQKLKIFEEVGVDLVLILNFTKEFSEQTAEYFLDNLHSKLPFSHLILGEDALFGKDRHATKEHVFELAKKLKFQVAYLKQLELDGGPISSSRIRTLIEKGYFSTAEKLLGRKLTF